MSQAQPRQPTGAEIAIIGMAGRFPGAPGVDALWENLKAGIESITRFSEEEMRAAGVDEATLADPAYVPATGWLPDAADFDAAFFGFAPREAESTDPQHRVFLETAWAAMEHAGYGPGTYAGPVGVYAGMGASGYLLHNLLPYAAELGRAGFDVMVGNDKDYLPTRVSYKLGLRGPSVNVQTACSTSLVAVHVACRALLGGECDIALAGGVSISSVLPRGYVWRDGGIAAADGHCRAFDESAAGTVGGAGADSVTREAYSHAASSAGFWPGNEAFPQPAFYAYFYPGPEGYSAASVGPEAAYYSTEMGEWLLPYEAVRTAPDPDAALREFLETTYAAGATLAGWDRAALERPGAAAG